MQALPHYSGESKDGLPYGYGNLKCEKYEYEGFWISGKKMKMGKLVSSVGTYIGEFLHDMKHGVGTMTYSNGDEYIGNWAKDRREGLGKLIFANKDTYEGEFVDDQIQGYGFLTFGIQKTFQGRFRTPKDLINNFENVQKCWERLFNGIGTLKVFEGITHRGTWLNGTLMDGFTVTESLSTETNARSTVDKLFVHNNAIGHC